MPGPIEEAVSGPRRTCTICGAPVEWVPRAWLHVTPPADRHLPDVAPVPPPYPPRALEDHVLALQEAGRPFSAILDVARAVDRLSARVDDLEAVVPADVPAPSVPHVPRGTQP